MVSLEVVRGNRESCAENSVFLAVPMLLFLHGMLELKIMAQGLSLRVFVSTPKLLTPEVGGLGQLIQGLIITLDDNISLS